MSDTNSAPAKWWDDSPKYASPLDAQAAMLVKMGPTWDGYLPALYELVMAQIEEEEKGK